MRFDLYQFYEYLFSRKLRIRMDAGDPDIPPPQGIVRVLEREVHRLSYAPPGGLPELREAIADFHGVDREEVVVVPGAKAAIAAVIARSGMVGLIAPFWPGYAAAARVMGSSVKVIHADRSSGWMVDVDEFSRLAGMVDTVIVNYPNNPSGAVLDKSTASVFMDEARRRGALLVSDEAYRDIVFEGERLVLAELGVEGVVSVYSFSKTFSLPGLRVGYAVGDKEVIRWIRDFIAATFTGVPIYAQQAALAALDLWEERSRSVVEAYRRRVEIALRYVDREVFDVVRPRGTFYLFLRSKTGLDGVELAYRLADRGVGVFPGAAFGGDKYRGYVRVSLTQSPGVIVEGLRVLGEEAWKLSGF